MLPNEKVLFTIKRSPLALGRGVLDLLLTLLFVLLSAWSLAEVPFWDSWWLVEEYRKLATRFLWEGAGIPASWIAIALGFVALLLAFDMIYRLSRESSTRYDVSNVRLSTRHGLARKFTEDLYLLSVDGVALEQGFLGRLFGWATLKVMGRGNNSLELSFVRQPGEVKSRLDRVVLASRMKAPKE
ncbi:MAG: PH domain-containing protein [Marinobacterium sp.]